MKELPTARSGRAPASLYSLLARGRGNMEKHARLLVLFSHLPAEQQPWIMGHRVKPKALRIFLYVDSPLDENGNLIYVAFVVFAT